MALIPREFADAVVAIGVRQAEGIRRMARMAAGFKNPQNTGALGVTSSSAGPCGRHDPIHR
jgi:hypothetical protein